MVIKINMSSSYEIIIEENGFNKALNAFIDCDDVYVITDQNVFELYLRDKKIEILNGNYKEILIPSGEEHKCLATYEYIISEILKHDSLNRKSLLIALGGGVVGDITGFVASTLYRGLRYINIPTTLLSQVDSSIGGKTGINYGSRKNIIGAFKQPELVLIDPLFISTNTKEDYLSGLGEIIKHALIQPGMLLSKIKIKAPIHELIYESILIKKHFVEVDEWDQRERMVLNFGHTFGHVIELEEQLPHGLAVIFGMLCEMDYAIDLGITPREVKEELLEILDIYGIQIKSRDYNEYLEHIFADKKNIGGTVHFIYLTEIGCPKILKIRKKDNGYITKTD